MYLTHLKLSHFFRICCTFYPQVCLFFSKLVSHFFQNCHILFPKIVKYIFVFKIITRFSNFFRIVTLFSNVSYIFFQVVHFVKPVTLFFKIVPFLKSHTFSKLSQIFLQNCHTISTKLPHIFYKIVSHLVQICSTFFPKLKTLKFFSRFPEFLLNFLKLS